MKFRNVTDEARYIPALGREVAADEVFESDDNGLADQPYFEDVTPRKAAAKEKD